MPYILFIIPIIFFDFLKNDDKFCLYFNFDLYKFNLYLDIFLLIHI